MSLKQSNSAQNCVERIKNLTVRYVCQKNNILLASRKNLGLNYIGCKREQKQSSILLTGYEEYFAISK